MFKKFFSQLIKEKAKSERENFADVKHLSGTWMNDIQIDKM